MRKKNPATVERANKRSLWREKSKLKSRALQERFKKAQRINQKFEDKSKIQKLELLWRALETRWLSVLLQDELAQTKWDADYQYINAR